MKSDRWFGEREKRRVRTLLGFSLRGSFFQRVRDGSPWSLNCDFERVRFEFVSSRCRPDCPCNELFPLQKQQIDEEVITSQSAETSECKPYLDDEHQKSSCMSVGEEQASRVWTVLERMQQNNAEIETCSEKRNGRCPGVRAENPCHALFLVSYLNHRRTLFQGRIVTSQFLDRRHVVRSDVIHGQIRLQREKQRPSSTGERNAASTWTNSGTEIGRLLICFWLDRRSWCNSRLISSTALVCCLIISAIFFCNAEIVCW